MLVSTLRIWSEKKTRVQAMHTVTTNWAKIFFHNATSGEETTDDQLHGAKCSMVNLYLIVLMWPMSVSDNVLIRLLHVD